MTVSLVTDERLVVPPVLGWAVLTGGAVALFATYWDEAWHTDIGRDSAWIAPHLLLYGAMAVAGSAIAAWGVRTWWTTRSLRTALRYQPVLVAGLGGAATLAAAPIDLRQGTYARRRTAWPSTTRKVAMILGIAALAHGAIAVADTLMLQRIAERRYDALQQLVATTAPAVPTGGDDFMVRVADLLPRPTGTNRFVPLLSRVGGALSPIGPVLVVRTMNFDGNALTIECESPETGMADRVRAALSAAGVAAQVVAAPGGGLRIVARGA